MQPYPDRMLDPQDRLESRASIELAFVAALQRLPPRQAAALLLVDVLGYNTVAAATMLDIGPTAVKGLLQRARAATVGLPTSPEPDARQASLAARFADAYATDDVDGVVALLTDDAWLAMPPAPHIYIGPGPVAGFLRASATAHRAGVTLAPTGANLQPAFCCCLDGNPAGVVVITIRADRIAGITRFLDPGLNPRF